MIEIDTFMITPEEIKAYLLKGESVQTYDEVRMCSAYVTTFIPKKEKSYQVDVMFSDIKMSTETQDIEQALKYADQFRKAIDDTIKKIGFPHLRD